MEAVRARAAVAACKFSGEVAPPPRPVLAEACPVDAEAGVVHVAAAVAVELPAAETLVAAEPPAEAVADATGLTDDQLAILATVASPHKSRVAARQLGLKYDAKCMASRAYHAARKVAKAAGDSAETCGEKARAAHAVVVAHLARYESADDLE